jgi:hypothetical protein
MRSIAVSGILLWSYWIVVLVLFPDRKATSSEGAPPAPEVSAPTWALRVAALPAAVLVVWLIAYEQPRRNTSDLLGAALLGLLFAIVPTAAFVAAALRDRNRFGLIRGALMATGIVACSALVYGLSR